MKTFLPAMRLMVIAVLPAAAQTSGAPSADDGSAHATYQKFQDLKWEKIPELGAGSPEITILRVDPKSGATQLT